MKQSFLNSLKGKPVGQAKRLVMQHGYDWNMFDYDPAMSSNRSRIRVKNLVILWKKDGLVELAIAGDPVEVEDEPLITDQYPETLKYSPAGKRSLAKLAEELFDNAVIAWDKLEKTPEQEKEMQKAIREHKRKKAKKRSKQ